MGGRRPPSAALSSFRITRNSAPALRDLCGLLFKICSHVPERFSTSVLVELKMRHAERGQDSRLIVLSWTHPALSHSHGGPSACAHHRQIQPNRLPAGSRSGTWNRRSRRTRRNSRSVRNSTVFSSPVHWKHGRASLRRAPPFRAHCSCGLSKPRLSSHLRDLCVLLFPPGRLSAKPAVGKEIRPRKGPNTRKGSRRHRQGDRSSRPGVNACPDRNERSQLGPPFPCPSVPYVDNPLQPFVTFVARCDQPPGAGNATNHPITCSSRHR